MFSCFQVEEEQETNCKHRHNRPESRKQTREQKYENDNIITNENMHTSGIINHSNTTVDGFTKLSLLKM